MSRTYKDRPLNIKLADNSKHYDRNTIHRCGPRWVIHKEVLAPWDGKLDFDIFKPRGLVEIDGTTYRVIKTIYRTEYRDCDLEVPVKDLPDGQRSNHCYYYPSWRSYDSMTPDMRSDYHRSHRRSAKNVNRKLRDEYNLHGDIDTDYTFIPHRKNALFGGGYIN